MRTVAGLQQYVKGLQCSLKWSHPRVMLTELGSMESPLLYRVRMQCSLKALCCTRQALNAEAMVPCRTAPWRLQP